MTLPPATSLILASTSPYRKALLERLMLPFEVIAPAVDETPNDGETPAAAAARLALAKARAVAKDHPAAIVIGSDQTATLDGKVILGKPGTHERATRQLLASSGRSMRFHTAMAVVCEARDWRREVIVDTVVRFRALTAAQIEAYLLKEQPYDCAGSAKAEALGISLVESIDSSDPTALIGLPLIALTGLLEQAGLPVLGR